MSLRNTLAAAHGLAKRDPLCSTLFVMGVVLTVYLLTRMPSTEARAFALVKSTCGADVVHDKEASEGYIDGCQSTERSVAAAHTGIGAPQIVGRP